MFTGSGTCWTMLDIELGHTRTGASTLQAPVYVGKRRPMAVRSRCARCAGCLSRAPSRAQCHYMDSKDTCLSSGTIQRRVEIQQILSVSNSSFVPERNRSHRRGNCARTQGTWPCVEVFTIDVTTSLDRPGPFPNCQRAALKEAGVSPYVTELASSCSLWNILHSLGHPVCYRCQI